MPVPMAFVTMVLIWSTTPLAIKWSSSPDVSFLEGVTIRMLAGAIIASLLLRAFGVRRHYSWAALRLYASGALGFCGAMTLVYWAAQHVPSGVVALVFGAAPLVAGVLGAWLLNEHALTPLRVLALLGAMLGLYLVSSGEATVNAGAVPAIAALLLATVFYALSGTLVKRFSLPMHPLAQVGGALWISAGLLVLAWLISDAQLPPKLDARTAGAIAYLSVFGSVLGFMLFYFLLNRLPVATVSLVTLMTPPSALVVGWLVAGEQFTGTTLIGGVCVIAALAVYQWGDGLLARF